MSNQHGTYIKKTRHTWFFFSGIWHGISLCFADFQPVFQSPKQRESATMPNLRRALFRAFPVKDTTHLRDIFTVEAVLADPLLEDR